MSLLLTNRLLPLICSQSFGKHFSEVPHFIWGSLDYLILIYLVFTTPLMVVPESILLTPLDLTLAKLLST